MSILRYVTKTVFKYSSTENGTYIFICVCVNVCVYVCEMITVLMEYVYLTT